MKSVRIILLTLIILGLGAIATERLWVPGLVAQKVKKEQTPQESDVVRKENQKSGNRNVVFDTDSLSHTCASSAGDANIGLYQFEESPLTSGSDETLTYVLCIEGSGPNYTGRLAIDGFQTLTRMYVTASLIGNGLRVNFDHYAANDVHYEVIPIAGTELFSIDTVHQNKIIWGWFSPMVTSSASATTAFMRHIRK